MYILRIKLIIISIFSVPCFSTQQTINYVYICSLPYDHRELLFWCRHPKLLVLEGVEMGIVTRMTVLIFLKHCWKLTMTLSLMMRMLSMNSVHLKKLLKVMLAN